MLDEILESMLGRIPALRIAVVGDLFLDRYLDIDARLTEPSIETGLDAYQITRVRSYPGAAGTVINNLAALGVGAIVPVAVIGDDGEGYELGQALGRLGVVETSQIIRDGSRRTPTYTKPMLEEPGKPARELNRLDIKNRIPTAASLEHKLVEAIRKVEADVDALLILDQVSEEDCGVVTARIRNELSELGARRPKLLTLADSRERLGQFRNVGLKPNEAEARLAWGTASAGLDLAQVLMNLARQNGRPIFCTRGDRGITLADPVGSDVQIQEVPGYPVSGPIDVVGAGDSTTAAIACALASGATKPQAAAFGNLIASITIQQLGTTGTASPQQVRERWRQVRK
ncbi:MAG TPA: PfkB family carbohydrate kinase [Gemmataceae bacterium]|jgi:rfaE bifunctional protein kinase chain/domain|nr:PfkB family carbohydrate kinase [Gemmataceae bacterium]